MYVPNFIPYVDSTHMGVVRRDTDGSQRIRIQGWCSEFQLCANIGTISDFYCSLILLNFNTTIMQSIVMPVHNGSRWLNDCLTSILSQTGFNPGSLEFSVYNDASTVRFYVTTVNPWCIVWSIALALVPKPYSLAIQCCVIDSREGG